MGCGKNFGWVGNFRQLRKDVGNPDPKGRENDPYYLAKIAPRNRRIIFCLTDS